MKNLCLVFFCVIFLCSSCVVFSVSHKTFKKEMVIIFLRRRGGIGRRVGFKIQFSFESTGSSPVVGNIFPPCSLMVEQCASNALIRVRVAVRPNF